MSTTIKSSADGTQAIIQVNGVDKVVVGSTGIESGSYKAGSIRPVDTELGALPSMVRVNTYAGYGSTNNKIMRFTTVLTNQGSDITYADSASLGAAFTVNVDGVYAISYCGNLSPQNAFNGLSNNSTELTTVINSINAAHRLSCCQTYSAGAGSAISWTGHLTSGSVVRVHTDGNAPTVPNISTLTISRVA